MEKLSIFFGKIKKKIHFSPIYTEISKIPSENKIVNHKICHTQTAFRFPNFLVVFELELKKHFFTYLAKIAIRLNTPAECFGALINYNIEFISKYMCTMLVELKFPLKINISKIFDRHTHPHFLKNEKRGC